MTSTYLPVYLPLRTSWVKPRVTVEVPFGVGMACGVNPSSTPRSFAHRAASGIDTAPEEASPPFPPSLQLGGYRRHAVTPQSL